MGAESQVEAEHFCRTTVHSWLLEFIIPRRKRILSRKERWPVNLSMTFINSFVAQITVAAVPVMVSLVRHEISLDFFHT